MLLIREMWRVLTGAVASAWWSGRFWVVVAIALLALVAALTTTVTVLGPVVVYPFL